MQTQPSNSPPSSSSDPKTQEIALTVQSGETKQEIQAGSSHEPVINPPESESVSKAPSPPHFKWKDYDEKLKKVKFIALGTNIFYALNWFLGFCAVTWATTVILGGMVGNIRKRDYYSVALLLILEALRLATARFFGFFVTRHLIHCSADPTKLVYHDCRELAAKEVLRTLGQVVELAVLSVSIVLPARRLRDVQYQLTNSCSDTNSSACNFNAVQNSLQIFYTIVLANAVIAAVGAIYSKTIVYVHFDATSYALRRYYHSIVWNCIVKGLLHSTDLDLMKFAFEVQAEEYKNNKRAADVMGMYKDLIMYLYEHPHHKGFEAASVALDSENTFVREAAANIVGLWISLGIGGGKTLMLQDGLLSKLADALGHQETGRAATSSFEQMAYRFPEQTAMIKDWNGRGDSLVDILIKRIHQVVVQSKHDKAIVFLKVLIALMEKLEDIRIYSAPGSAGVKTLSTDLDTIVKKCTLKRTQVSAAYVLVQLAESSSYPDVEVVNVRTTLLALLDINVSQGGVKNKIDPSNNTKTSIKPPQETSTNTFCGVISWIWTPVVLTPVRLLCSLIFIKLFTSVPSNIMGKLWNYLLDVLVGVDPQSTVGAAKVKTNAQQHILKYEVDQYLKKVVQFLHKEFPEHTEFELNSDGIFPSWTPYVQVRDVAPTHKLPGWLENIKITTYNVAILMVFLTLGLCSFFIFYPHIHL